MRDGQQPKPDPDTAAGIGSALGRSFPVPEGAGDFEADLAGIGSVRPDAAADARMDQLLERLKRLPWDRPPDGPRRRNASGGAATANPANSQKESGNVQED